jgi:hypothetical protein
MRIVRQGFLLPGALALLAGCAPNRAAPVPYELVGACRTPAHREIRLVRESAAFTTALRSLTAHAPRSEWNYHRAWRCQEMRREVFGGFHGLSAVRTVAIDGHWVRLDMYFGVTRDSVVLLNPRVVDESGIRVDTTAWNFFIRSRLNLELGFGGELAAFTCVIDRVADGWAETTDCWSPAPVNMSSDGNIFTVSRRDRNHDPSHIYRVRSDGSLAEIPRVHPMLDATPH